MIICGLRPRKQPKTRGYLSMYLNLKASQSLDQLHVHAAHAQTEEFHEVADQRQWFWSGDATLFEMIERPCSPTEMMYCKIVIPYMYKAINKARTTVTQSGNPTVRVGSNSASIILLPNLLTSEVCFRFAIQILCAVG